MPDRSGNLDVDVAVVGGGPAGLSAAIVLAAAGIRRICVLDREPEAGGVPRHCGHPPFGLREFGRILTGPGYAARLRRAAQDAGVDLRTGHSVVALREGGLLDVATADGRLAVSARRIVLATGMRELTRAALAVGGTRPLGVMNTGALQAHLHLEGLIPFRRPVIVGTQWVGLSAVSTCLRHGIRPVAVVEAGRRPAAPWPFSLFPRLAGIPLHVGTTVLAVEGRDRVEAVAVRHADGATRSLACDGVVFTGQFVPEATLARMGHVAVGPQSGAPVRDASGRSSDPRVYIAGNVSAEAKSAGWCFRDGARIAGHVVADLREREARP